MQSTVAHVRDHEVEMESDAERRKLTRVKGSDTGNGDDTWRLQ